MDAHDSKPALNDILESLAKLFRLAKAKGAKLSRVHTHPYGSFIMCYDERKWADGEAATIKSALTTPKYCMMAEDLG